VVRETGEAPSGDFPLAVAFLEANQALTPAGAGETAKKKALNP
jgi:hypothetical protein